jgi:hypothetical protein
MKTDEVKSTLSSSKFLSLIRGEVQVVCVALKPRFLASLVLALPGWLHEGSESIVAFIFVWNLMLKQSLLSSPVDLVYTKILIIPPLLP